MTARLLSMLLLALPLLSAQTATRNLHFYVEAASFSAEGTWIPVDPKSHAAYQAETEVDCEKRTATCTEATADYFDGHPHISVDSFQIIKWDRNGIVASSAEGVCATRKLTIAFAAMHMSDTREAKVLPSAKQEACHSLGVPSSEGWTMALKNSKEWEAERNRKHME